MSNVNKKYINSRRMRTSLIGMTVLVLGIASLMVGIHRREHVMVAQKSNMICLECIGIG